MYGTHSNRPDHPQRLPGPIASPNLGIPGSPPIEPREDSLREILKKESGVLEVRLADVIYAVDEETNERRWLIYGDPDLAAQPIDPFRPFDWPFILDVRVDRDGDDFEVLAQAVRNIKGSCHYLGELWEVLENPEVISDLQDAAIVYAVDYLTGRRCGLYFGDPAMESLPRPEPLPWDSPFLLEFCLHNDNDEPEMLAEAVRRIKGSCTYRPGP